MIQGKQIDISTGIIFRTILVLLLMWFLYAIREIIALVFISIIIVSVIDPIANRLQGKKVSRTLVVFFIFLVIFLILGILISFLIPLMIDQFKDLTQKLPEYSKSAENYFKGVENYFQAQNIDFSVKRIFDSFVNSISEASGGLFVRTIGFFHGLISFIVVMFISFYLASKKDGIKNFVVLVTPDKHKEYATTLVERINQKIGKWMQGQLLAMLIIFIFNFIGLSIIGVPYALILAFMAGILEIMPFVGPIIAAIPAIILGLTVSPFVGLLVLILYIVTHQIESHIVIPQIMNKIVGLDPIVVILVLLIGLKLGGVTGAVLAIPVATTISVFVKDLFNDPKKQIG